jgi:triacylglycerol lipase
MGRALARGRHACRRAPCPGASPSNLETTVLIAKLLRWLAIAAVALCALPAPTWASGYAQTRYPIVLVHGLFGFDNIGPLEYFYGIPEHLRANGAQVFVSQVSAANSTEVRGEQLLTYVKQVLAVTGAAKVNLIGHSHGGPTVRYVASVAPDLVASVTSVAGPNQGAALADALNGTLPAGSLSRSAVATIVNGFASVIALASGNSGAPQNSSAALDSLSAAGMAKFNAAHPEGLPTSSCGQGPALVNGVRYYSWSGAQPYTNALDPIDPALALTALVYGSAKNDGLVSSCSSHLGVVIRDDYGMNHLDEVNQMAGIVNWFEVDPKSLYRLQANRLKNAGL